MTAAQINSALATRQTVRVQYCRTTDTHRVDVVIGDAIQYTILIGCTNPDRAEHYAANAAAILDLDITRVDVP